MTVGFALMGCGTAPLDDDDTEGVVTTRAEPLVAASGSAGAAALTMADCNSAIPSKSVDFKTFVETCRRLAAEERARMGGPSLSAATAAAGEVYANRKAMSAMNATAFSAVPTWSDADILSMFPLTRDNQYLTDENNDTSPLRRISWMFPENGCQTRAELVAVQAAQAGKLPPYKLFAFNFPQDLRVYTDNTPSGMVTWGWHVAAVVKNTAGEPIVFDPAISPCKPLPWKKWLATMADDISVFNDVAGENGVGLGDSSSYGPYSLMSGEPSHSTEARTEQEQWWLMMEWNRAVELGRDPYVVFGANPPWSGYACVTTELEQVTQTVGANFTGNVTATCPFPTLAVGGGLALGAPQGFAVAKNAKSGNGWQVIARNNSGSSNTVTANAVCLTGAPANASVSTVTGNTANINANGFGSSSATCSSGTMVGGGYSTTQGSSIVRVYNNARSNGTSSTWQVSGYNTTSSSKSLTAYGYCLSNTNFTYNQISSGMDNGVGFLVCSPKTVLGGGYKFPWFANYSVYGMYPFGPEIFVSYITPEPPSGDPTVRAYAECLAHP
jgi:hypothetical protein